MKEPGEWAQQIDGKIAHTTDYLWSMSLESSLVELSEWLYQVNPASFKPKAEIIF